MQSLYKLCLFLGLAVSLASAAPAPAALQKRTFKVERAVARNAVPHRAPRQLLRAFLKHKFVVPPEGAVEALTAHLASLDQLAPVEARAVGVNRHHRKKKGKGSGTGAGTNSTSAVGGANGINSTAAAVNGTQGTGAVTATPANGNAEFVAPVTLGGSQQLNLDFDTGSSDLWVFSNKLSAAQIGQHDTIFDPAKSDSFQLLKGQTWNISYGDGSFAAGVVGTETVNIGGATVTSQAVELATKVAKSFTQDTDNDGLVGLAFSQLNTVQPQPVNTFLDNVLPSLQEPVFTADLRHNARGTYEFGRRRHLQVQRRHEIRPGRLVPGLLDRAEHQVRRRRRARHHRRPDRHRHHGHRHHRHAAQRERRRRLLERGPRCQARQRARRLHFPLQQRRQPARLFRRGRQLLGHGQGGGPQLGPRAGRLAW